MRSSCSFMAALVIAFAIRASGQDLKSTSNRADYVVITPASYLPLAQRLASFRHQKNGFATMVVQIDTVLSQFGRSVSADTALKDFIQYTLSSWTDPKPLYFVLAGNVNAIPSHPDSETITTGGAYDTLLSIDQWYVKVPTTGHDFQTNACLGRFPAWDSAGLAVMVDKTIEYENDPEEQWRNRAISLADYRAEDGAIFELDSRRLRLYLDSLWTDTVAVHVRMDSPDHLDPDEFIDLWNQGAAIVSYTGHANESQFSYSKYFTVKSIDSLKNGNRLPVCFLGGCQLTFDSEPDSSIAVGLLRHEGGGAVAVVSSAGMMWESTAFYFFVSMVQSMTANPDQPIGESYREAMSWQLVHTWSQAVDRFTLLGDPALVVKHSDIPAYIAVAPGLPSSFALEQNYPNPFNPTTTIGYKLSASSLVSLKVYDVLGREVRTLVYERQGAGNYSVKFNAGGMASGVYFCVLSARPLSGQGGRYTATRKLMLMK